MIKDHAIARRYARALIMSADNSDLDKLEEQFAKLSASINLSFDFKNLFANPSFSVADKKNVIEKIAEKFELSLILKHFLLLLLRKKRMNLLELIYKEFVLLLDEKNKRLRVSIQSASKVENEIIEELKASFAKAFGMNVIIDTSIDKDLIGGISLKTPAMVFDGTIKNRLSSLKEGLLKQIG